MRWPSFIIGTDMKEADIIAATDKVFGGPITFEKLKSDLQSLGIRQGDVLLVHSSLSAVGWISGGTVTLINALLASIGDKGTLAMPAHSGALSNPGLWENPPVPSSWLDPVRDSMPPFVPSLTPTRGIGIVPEIFRNFPDVLRSSHPMDSFCACGPMARVVVSGQRLENGLGEGSPLAHLYDLNARILLIGCGYDSNTSLHLAEHRGEWPGKKRNKQGSPVIENGRRVWKWFEELDLDTDDFEACGQAFEEKALNLNIQKSQNILTVGKVGLAESRLMSLPALVDFAVPWFSTSRGTKTEEGQKS